MSKTIFSSNAIARRPSSVWLCPSVCKLFCANRFFYHRNGWIATILAHDGPQKSPHPGCAQGHGQGQRSRDTDQWRLIPPADVGDQPPSPPLPSLLSHSFPSPSRSFSPPLPVPSLPLSTPSPILSFPFPGGSLPL